MHRALSLLPRNKKNQVFHTELISHLPQQPHTDMHTLTHTSIYTHNHTRAFRVQHRTTHHTPDVPQLDGAVVTHSSHTRAVWVPCHTVDRTHVVIVRADALFGCQIPHLQRAPRIDESSKRYILYAVSGVIVRTDALSICQVPHLQRAPCNDESRGCCRGRC